MKRLDKIAQAQWDRTRPGDVTRFVPARVEEHIVHLLSVAAVAQNVVRLRHADPDALQAAIDALQRKLDEE